MFRIGIVDDAVNDDIGLFPTDEEVSDLKEALDTEETGLIELDDILTLLADEVILNKICKKEKKKEGKEEKKTFLKQFIYL